MPPFFPRGHAPLRTLIVVGFTAAALPAAAQSGARVQVSVSDEATRAPIVGAQVGLRLNRTAGLTDSLGIIVIDGLMPGSDTIIVRFPGYASSATPVGLRDGSASYMSVRLRQDVTTLPTVTVAAEAVQREPGLGFARRQKMGLGHFVMRKEIERYAPLRSSDILRRVPGVRVRANRAGDHVISMARAATSCRVQYYVDNVPMPTEELVDAAIDQRAAADIAQGGGSAASRARARSRMLNRDLQAFTIDQIPPEWIEAIEVYRGAAEIPTEYRSTGAICGVVLVWTRTGS